jgi:hypothetical protein
MNKEGLEHWRHANHYLYATILEPAGRILFLKRTIGGAVILGTGDEFSVNEMFTYEDEALAVEGVNQAVAGFEPTGWIRHQPSNRRRMYNADGTYTEEVRE